MTTPVTTPRKAIPNGRQMTLKLSVLGQEAALVLGALGPQAGHTEVNAALWRDRAWNALKGVLNGSVTCLGATVRGLDVNATQIYELAAPATPTGTVGGVSGLLAGATLVKWNTATGGRSGKGRSFLPGLPAAALSADGRTLVATHVTAVKTGMTAYLQDTALSGAGIQPAVLSFTKGVGYVITSADVALIAGIQRRRMR